MTSLRVLFVGESWLGSGARSLKEALARRPIVCLDEVNEDLVVPQARARWLRGINRLLRSAYQQELRNQILYRVDVFRPDVVVAYKGAAIDADLVRTVQARGCRVVNVYPDCSPHAYGPTHREAIGAYDLVVSTKYFHPALWQSVYGFVNRCTFVPQGYDPALHVMAEAPSDAAFDVVLVATWRSEYGELMRRLGHLLSDGVSVAIGGHGWTAHSSDFPKHWFFPGGLQGRAYLEFLRRGRICVAPVTRDVVINGVRQPGDEESARTYELAAGHCFFIHRRTDFALRLYDELTQVPMYGTPEELAEKVVHFLALPRERARMASAAHRRAVPAYGLDKRADEVISALEACTGHAIAGGHCSISRSASRVG